MLFQTMGKRPSITIMEKAAIFNQIVGRQKIGEKGVCECTSWRCKDIEVHIVSTHHKTTGNYLVCLAKYYCRDGLPFQDKQA